MTEKALAPDIAFYSPRSGEGVRHAADKLSKPPEKILDQLERAEVIAFEANLMEGVYQTEEQVLDSGLGKSLEEVWKSGKYSTSLHEVCIEYLQQEQAGPFIESLGIDSAYLSDTEAALAQLRVVSIGADREILKALSTKSRVWAKNLMTQNLVDGVALPELSYTRVFDSKEAFVNGLSDISQFRAFLHKVRSTLRREPDTLESNAKSDITDIYLKVLNQTLAVRYADGLALVDQLNTLGDAEGLEDLARIWPTGQHIANFSSEGRQKYLAGLDRIRNGTSLESGNFSAVTKSLTELANAGPVTMEQLSIDELPVFSPEEVERLSEVKVDSVGLQALFKDMLAEFGKLSEEHESSYASGRSERAIDGKWQVVIAESDAVSGLSVDGAEGVVKIPRSFYRSLTRAEPPAGVLSVVAHELIHTFQLDNLRANSGSLALTKNIKGRSSMALREAGGVQVEQVVQARLFGQLRQYNDTYLNGVIDLENGLSFSEMLQNAFDRAVLLENETPPDVAKASYARMKRLVRHGGYDSQALNYLQSALIIEESRRLDTSQRERLFSEGAFDLPDMVTLHGYGLIDSSPEAFPVDIFVQKAERYLRKFLNH